MLVLFVGVWVASALAATTAALAWRARGERNWKNRALVLVVGGLPLGFAVWMVGLWIYSGFLVGFGSVPVGLAGTGLGLHVAGLIGLALASRRPGWGPAPGPWVAAALVGAALTVLLFGQLELRARLYAANLRLEGGELARELLRPPPEPEEDAWPHYVAFRDRLGSVVDLDAWDEDVYRTRKAGALDLDDVELLARVEQAAPVLAEARRACRLPDCDFGGRRVAERKDWLSGSGSISAAVGVSQAWLLEGSVAAAQGRMDLAYEDLECLFRLSEQAAASALLIDLQMGSVERGLALALFARVLSADPEPRIARLRVCLPAPLAPRATNALEMELAWCLSTFGLLEEGHNLFDDVGGWMSDLNADLYLVFRFERDVRGYRTTFEEFRELAAGSFADLRAARDSGEILERVETRGMLALMAAPNITTMLWHLRRGDAELKQAARAIDAFEVDRTAALAQGTWVADDPLWGDDPPEFSLREAP